MIVLRDKNFARADYKGLSKSASKFLRAERDQLARELKNRHSKTLRTQNGLANGLGTEPTKLLHTVKSSIGRELEDSKLASDIVKRNAKTVDFKLGYAKENARKLIKDTIGREKRFKNGLSPDSSNLSKIELLKKKSRKGRSEKF